MQPPGLDPDDGEPDGAIGSGLSDESRFFGTVQSAESFKALLAMEVRSMDPMISSDIERRILSYPVSDLMADKARFLQMEVDYRGSRMPLSEVVCHYAMRGGVLRLPEPRVISPSESSSFDTDSYAPDLPIIYS